MEAQCVEGGHEEEMFLIQLFDANMIPTAPLCWRCRHRCGTRKPENCSVSVVGPRPD